MHLKCDVSDEVKFKSKAFVLVLVWLLIKPISCNVCSHIVIL